MEKQRGKGEAATGAGNLTSVRREVGRGTAPAAEEGKGTAAGAGAAGAAAAPPGPGVAVGRGHLAGTELF